MCIRDRIDAADGERNQRNDESFLPILHKDSARLPGPGKFRPMTAIEEINEQANDEPDYESAPCNDGQSCHQQKAEDHAERGDDGTAGDDETAAPFGLAEAQDDDADRDEDEGE